MLTHRGRDNTQNNNEEVGARGVEPRYVIVFEMAFLNGTVPVPVGALYSRTVRRWRKIKIYTWKTYTKFVEWTPRELNPRQPVLAQAEGARCAPILAD